MQVDIWSDIACPWCYIGKRRFEKALAQFEHAAEVTVTWHSFLLDPSAPASYGIPIHELLAKKYGMSLEQAKQANQRLAGVAASEGLAYQLDIAKPGNTFDAHRLTHFAMAQGLREVVMDRFMRAYLCEGEELGNQETLARLSGEAGLDLNRVREVLASDAFAENVRGDVDLAHRLGINAVPFFVMANQYGLSGAQPVEVMLQALRETWDKTASLVSAS